MTSYLDSLDPDQLKAVLAPAEPTRILAGAGSGKTRLLISRIANQIETGVAKPEEMFIAAFTRSAADEMAERITDLVDSGQLSIRTFHGLMFGFLNEERFNQGAEKLDICKPSEQQRIFQGLLGKKSKDWPQAINIQADLGTVMGHIGVWKNELIRHDAQEILDTIHDAPYGSDMWSAASVYGLYEKHLASIGKIDFDDMLCKTYDLFTQSPGALSRAQGKWTAFFIDEAQDSNKAQMEILKLIAPPSSNPNITIVGDLKQALYRFRGAVPELMDDFMKDYSAESILLDRNYRSTSKIIDSANRLARVFREPQVSQRHDGNEPIGIRVLDEMEQAVEISSFVQEARDKGHRGGEIAVLIRTNAQSAEIERAFVAAKLPYWCAGGGFFDHMEIGDLMAYLRLAADHTNTSALNRIINKPTRYLGRAFVDQVEANSVNYGGDLVDTIRFTTRYNNKALWAKQLDASSDLADLLQKISPANGMTSAVVAIQTILDETKYLDWLRTTSGTSEGADDSRKENIDALKSIATEFGTIEALIKFADEASMLQQQSGDATEICTVHRSKGREWPYVIVANFYDDSFPHKLSETPVQRMDERRVAYVAFTRAQDHLIVMVPQVDPKGAFVAPSPFLIDAKIEPQDPVPGDCWWADIL